MAEKNETVKDSAELQFEIEDQLKTATTRFLSALDDEDLSDDGYKAELMLLAERCEKIAKDARRLAQRIRSSSL